MYRPPSSPYCGFSRDSSTQQLSAAEGACHLLVSAPTETGKTRGVLAPAAVLWAGPRCACHLKTT